MVQATIKASSDTKQTRTPVMDSIIIDNSSHYIDSLVIAGMGTSISHLAASMDSIAMLVIDEQDLFYAGKAFSHDATTTDNMAIFITGKSQGHTIQNSYIFAVPTHAAATIMVQPYFSNMATVKMGTPVIGHVEYEENPFLDIPPLSTTTRIIKSRTIKKASFVA